MQYLHGLIYVKHLAQGLEYNKCYVIFIFILFLLLLLLKMLNYPKHIIKES